MSLMEEHLKALIGLFNHLKIKYAVLGGLAVVLYGEPRLTADIDVNIAMEKNRLDSFLSVAKKFGFYPIPSNIKLFFKRTGVLPMKFARSDITGRCDIIIAENAIENMGIKRAKLKKIGSTKAKFVSAEDLVIHKITSDRPRDTEDLKGILMRQQGKLDIQYINLWLKNIARLNNKPELLRRFKTLLRKYYYA